MDRPHRDSRQHNGITVRPLSQLTFATKSATGGLMQCRASLFDHLIGSRQEGWRNGETERLCSFEINHQLEFRWLLNRQIGWLGSSRDAIDELCGTPVHYGEAWPIGQ